MRAYQTKLHANSLEFVLSPMFRSQPVSFLKSQNAFGVTLHIEINPIDRDDPCDARDLKSYAHQTILIG
jgi:hypothetical protein